MRDPYRRVGDIYEGPDVVRHDDEAYDAELLGVLSAMQERHFWYRGRHRFVLRALDLAYRTGDARPPQRTIDLGGGAGGWLRYLLARQRLPAGEVALGDSSPSALRLARSCLPDRIELFHLDLCRLGWEERWDLVFLLDVVEHFERDAEVLMAVARALAPGGMLFLTVPALGAFWSWNDVAVHHRRRYAKTQLMELLDRAGLVVRCCRYFMFLLSPLLLLSRRAVRPRASPEAIRVRLLRSHRIPPWPVNEVLASIFACETPLGHRLPFPWGASLLAVGQKPIP